MTDNDARMASLMHVALDVTAQVGGCTMSLRDVLGLGSGSVVALDREAGGPIDLFVNGELIARGELLAVDERYGVRITELLGRSHHPP